MCDISASRKSLTVIFLTLFLIFMDVDGQTNRPQFYPNPSYNPKLNLQNVNDYNTRQNNPQYGGAGELYHVDDAQNPEGFSSPNIVYGEPRRTHNFEGDANNIPLNRDSPTSRHDLQGQIPNNPGDIGPNSGQIPVNPGQVPFDSDFSRRNRFNGDIQRLLQGLDTQASQQCTSNVAAQWNFETNINERTQTEAVSI